MSTAPVETNALAKSNGAPPPSAPQATNLPQYIQGFEGAACAPFAPEALAVLGAPVNGAEVETKPNGIVYLPGVWYRRMLTRAFGAGAWALLPRGPARTMGEIVIYHGALYILGRFVSEAVGECETRFGMSYASSLEGARTDALTRCCKDLGMAAELWDPEWRADWQAKYTKKEWKKAANGKEGWHFTKLDTPNSAPAPVSGRNSGGQAQLPVTATGKGEAKKKPQGGFTEAKAADHETRPATPEEQAEFAARQAATFPKAEVPAGADTAGSLNATATPPTETSGHDTGVAPTAEQIQAVRDAVKPLKWSKPKAGAWLKGLFGETRADALTSDQAAAALALLMAAAVDDDDKTYGKILAKLEGEGRVLRP